MVWPVALSTAVLLATTACAAPNTQAGATPIASASPSAALPSGVLSRADILSRFASNKVGVTTQAKLVRLADLAKADEELTQCQARGCPPGALVWLVLQNGPPGTFGHGSPAGYKPPADADAWDLFPVDATTGQGRGDTMIGQVSKLDSSPWTSVQDLAPSS